MDTKHIEVVMEKNKKIALVAHDGKKTELLDWVIKNKELLQRHFLYGTGTTGSLIQQKANLPVKIFKSGPLGGDQQIGARIVDGEINFLIFLWDPLEAQPHDPDIKALLRIASLYDIPTANNLATADFIINSRYMNEEYTHKIINYEDYIKNRTENL